MIPIQMLKDWKYVENERGDVRHLQRGWRGEVGADAAIGLVAAEAARALVPLSAEQMHSVEVVKAVLAGDQARVDELMAGASLPPTADPDPVADGVEVKTTEGDGAPAEQVGERAAEEQTTAVAGTAPAKKAKK